MGAKKHRTPDEIFDALDSFRRFCVVYGRPFDEAALFDERNWTYADYLSYRDGRKVADHWIRDANVMKSGHRNGRGK